MPRDKDLRRFPRFAVGPEVASRQSGTWVSEAAANISKGGVFVRTTRPFRKGRPLNLEIQLADGEALAIYAQVVWRDTTPGHVGVGFDVHWRVERL